MKKRNRSSRLGSSTFLAQACFASAALTLLLAPGLLAFEGPAGGANARPVVTLQGVPAGELVEAPGSSEKAELVGLDRSLAAGLLKVGLEQSAVLSGWPIAPGERADVLLTRHDVYAPDAEIWEVGKEGKRRLPRSKLVFLLGHSTTDEEIRVMVSVDPANLELRGWTVMPAGAHELQPVPKSWNAGARYVVGPRDLFLDAEGQAVANEWSCGQNDLPEPLKRFTGSGTPPVDGGKDPLPGKAGITLLHTAMIAVDTDNQIMANKFGGNTTTATNYIASLFAQMNVIYERDLLVRLLQGTVLLRTTTDPYVVNDTTPYSDGQNVAMLNEFTSYWSGNQSGVNRALTLLLSGRGSSGASGIAWVDTLCDKGHGYAFSRLFVGGSTPSSGEVMVTAHELGHNFGSPHTHCYNTIGLTNPDQCYGVESFNNRACFAGAATCPAAGTYSGITGVRGTLMSYCHILGGCGLSLVFHTASVNLLDDIILSHTLGVNACVVPALGLGPTVAAVLPLSGSAAGGTPVTITGTGFVAGATVTFDTSAATSVDVASATTITAIAPAHATGPVRVTVTNPNATTGSKDNAFFYSPAPAATGFYTVTPCRVIDTRNPTGARGGPALQVNAARTFTVTGVCGIPANAKAISANVTVVAQQGSGSFTFYPGNAFPLGTNNLSFPAGANRAGASILYLSTNGTGTIGVTNYSAVNNHLILDVNGYFQ